MLFLPGQLILELSTLFSTGQIFATFLEDDKCNLILKYTKKQKTKQNSPKQNREYMDWGLVLQNKWKFGGYKCLVICLRAYQ